MLIIGAGGMASQLFDDIVLMPKQQFTFWSENGSKFRCIEDNFEIISTDDAVTDYFSNHSAHFAAAIWDINKRKMLLEKFTQLGGEATTFISPRNNLSSYTQTGKGCVILFETASEPDTCIGDYCVINKRVSFGHGCKVNSFCSVGPYSLLASDAEIGSGTYIGMGSIIQPKVKIGEQVIIAAGSVVTKNIPNHAVVSGNPAKIRFMKKNISLVCEK